MSKNWRFDGNELKYINEVLDNGFRAGADGAMTERVEALFAEKFNLPVRAGGWFYQIGDHRKLLEQNLLEFLKRRVFV